MNAIHALYQLSYSPLHHELFKEMQIDILKHSLKKKEKKAIKIGYIMILTLLGMVLALITLPLKTASIQSILKPDDKNTTQITISFSLDKDEFIFKDFITLSVDHPALVISTWHNDTQPLTRFVPSFKTTKQVFTKNFSISTLVTNQATEQPTQAHLYLSYLSSKYRTAQEQIIPLSLENKKTEAPAHVLYTPQTESPQAPLPPKTAPLTLDTYLETMIKTSEIIWVQLLLVLLLGLLMSLTPCIYPMIPITIGIMQGQGKRSLCRNFMLASAYTLGMALTFALLGLVAACSGKLFGSFASHPLVIVGITMFMIYLGFSMLGFYELYIPSFLRPGSTNVRGGSLPATFIFGALSGSVASPCLSPGLALVLSLVATLGNKWVGFLLLFSFGIGLSLPLLVIGTFSSSLHLMPQTGAWMVEIKKIFGFLLLAMALYYASALLPLYLTLWLLAFFITTIGCYYFYSITAQDTKQVKNIKNMMGFCLLAGSVLLFIEAYHVTNPTAADIFWHTNYKEAHTCAREHHHYLFLDCWAPSCSLCTAIDRKLFKDKAVRHALKRFVPLKLNMGQESETNQKIQEQFAIRGLPTFMLIDPTTDRIIKRWGSELYSVDKNAFIEELNKI
jgi:thiol:disulfide interchange protein DsbD